MFKKLLIMGLMILSEAFIANAQNDKRFRAGQMSTKAQHLLLELSSTYFTVVKENEIDLDSSLIHVSRMFSISRFPVVAEGINDADILKNAGWVDQRKPLTGEKQLTLLKGRQHAALSILLGAYYAFEPGNNIQSHNNSIRYLTQGIKDCDKDGYSALKLVANRLLGKLYLKDQNFIAADQLFGHTKDEFIKAGDISAAATTCAWWGLYAPVTPTSTKPRITHTEMAIALFKSAGDSEGVVNSLVNDSYLHMLNFDMAAAEKLAKEALGIAESLNFPYSHYITGALMSITMFQGKFGEPLAYSIESVKSAETTNDELSLPYFYGVVGVLYANEGGRDEIALDWEKKSIDLFVSQHEPCYMAYNDMVLGLLHQERKAEALQFIERVSQKVPPVTVMDKLFYYLTIGSYDAYIHQWQSALKAYDQAALFEKELEKHGLNVRKPTILLDLAGLYFNEGKFKQAKFYYRQYFAEPEVKKGGFMSNKTVAYENLLTIDSLTGDLKVQLLDYRDFMNITVHNYNVSKVRLAEELQVKYATSAKINQIKLLNQKAELEQQNLKQANLTKNITIAGIIMLMVIAGLLYRQGANRKKNNELITRKNEAMQKLLDEKEWLVKEIHHRVKNNLHTVICLLESQAMYLENDALQAVENSRHRIYAMSLIHQKLYQSEDIKVVDMKMYLADFIIYLQESFGSPENISINLSSDPIKLGAGQAIPVALVVNEAVTNAFKYAFPNQSDGKINITLRKLDDKIHLLITDDGIGFEQSSQEANSLGLNLINGLTLDLRGDILIESDYGTSIKIVFKSDRIDISAGHEDVLI